MMNQTELSHLDDLSMQEILSRLPIGERIATERTCQMWKTVINSSLYAVKFLVIYKNTRTLTIESNNLNYVVMENFYVNYLRSVLSRLPNVNDLRFDSFNELYESSVKAIIDNVPNLVAFSCIFPFGFYGNPLKNLVTKYSGIKKLTLRFAVLTEGDLRCVIRICQQLEYLDITGNNAVTGDSFSMFGTSLKSLLCSRCFHISAHAMTRLASGKGSNLLELETDLLGLSLEINDKLQAICNHNHLTKLQRLKLRSSFLSPEYRTECIAQLTSLRELIIIEMGPMMRHLDLQAIFKRCKLLKKLEIDLCAGHSWDVTDATPSDATFANIVTLLPHLKQITLRNARLVTAATIGEFAKLKDLKKVDFRGMPLPDHCLIHMLQNASKLTEMRLTYCKQVTNELIETAISVARTRPRDWLYLTLESCLDDSEVKLEDNLPRNFVFKNKSPFKVTFFSW